MRDDDHGSALVEFTWLAVLLLVPLLYLLVTVFTAQRAAFAVSAAAREAGRAYIAAEPAQARAAASEAARLVLVDHGLVPVGDPVSYPDGTSAQPGATFVLLVRYEVRLPLVGVFFRGEQSPAIPVTGRHVVTVERFRAR